MFLGVDCSTQSLKLIVINDLKEKQAEVLVNYDQELKHYNTQDGIIRHNTNGFDHVSTPTLMLVEALELGISKLKSVFDLSKIVAISGSGQQHGSVWWRKNSNALEKINSIAFLIENKSKLHEIFKDAFALEMSPIWMDSSTNIECNEITASVGSAQKLADLTGSRAYERFTGPQIKHLYKHQPHVYENTERISLISSFLASTLAGTYASIDYSDGSGMNILNIKSFKWDEIILNEIAPGLKEKLGEPVPSDSLVGCISPYWHTKFGFSSDCKIFTFSGDNPCSLVGLNLNQVGDVGISLGTSDVLFAVTHDPKPNQNEGSILVHPLDPHQYMIMLVYKNGSLTRKYIKDLIFQNDSDWSQFNEAIQNTPAGNDENIGFYFRETEITPDVLKTGIVKFDKENKRIDPSINITDCRAIIESQALSYKLHSKLLGLNEISSIVVTGGGSSNREILQIIADVFECDVRTSSAVNSAANGAAIRALNSYVKLNNIKSLQSVSHSSFVVSSNKKNFPIYRKLFQKFETLENQTVDFLNKFI